MRIVEISLDLHWYFGKQADVPINPEIFKLLTEIYQYGSLRAAAEQCGVSYRHAWGVLQKWQKQTGYALVNMERGKGTELSPIGSKILWQYQRIHARLEPDLANLASELNQDINDLLLQADKKKLKICASHGLAIGKLRDLAQEKGLAIDLQFHGSLDSLKLYKQGACDLAGFHIPEGYLGQRMVRRFKRYIHSEQDRLIYVIRRHQGLMTANGNPLAIHTLQDLSRASVRFINRQQNSGTRSTLDLLLEDAKLDQSSIQGYENEEFTHMAVAALVAGGEADCAYGIEPAAKRFNLHFIPLNWEQYWFVVNKEWINTVEMEQFIAVLSGTAFSQVVLSLSGYESQRAGEVVVPDDALTQLIS